MLKELPVRTIGVPLWLFGEVCTARDCHSQLGTTLTCVTECHTMEGRAGETLQATLWRALLRVRGLSIAQWQ